MPSSYTASLRFEQQFTGENVNTWGVRLNATTARIDFSIAGRASVIVSGTYALTSANASDDEARAAVIACVGTGGTLTIPSVTKLYRIENGCSAAVIVTTGGGSTVTVDAGDTTDVHCDGTNVKTPGVGGLSYKQYIASAVIGATGSLPASAGNAGKYLYSNGSTWFPRLPVVTDISDYGSDQATKIAAARGEAIAFAVAL